MTVPNFDEPAESILPNFVRIILLLATPLCFAPQFHRIWVRGDCSGISLYYVLLILMCATAQVSLAFCYLVDWEAPNTLVHGDHVSLGDWLNLAQLAVVWLCFLILLAACIFYPSEHYQRGAKFSSLIIYALFLALSLYPVISYAITTDFSYTDQADEFFLNMVTAFHAQILIPLATMMVSIGLVLQVSMIIERGSPGALSPVGQALPAVFFVLLAITWPLRIVFPGKFKREYLVWRMFEFWFESFGWPAVDSAVFAVTHAVLFGIALLHKGSQAVQPDHTGNSIHGSETDPLLGNEG